MRPFLKKVSDKIIIIRTSVPLIVFYLHYILYNTPLSDIDVIKSFFKFGVFSVFYLTIVILVAVINGLSNGWKYFWFSLLAIPAMFIGVVILGVCIFFLLITFGEGLSI